MEDKRAALIELFQEHLFCDTSKIDLLKQGAVNCFSCKFRKACEVDIGKHPIWSPAFGSEGATVMVIGEAPSASGGVGPHIGGLFSNWQNTNLSPVVPLRDWVFENYGCIPYFTDAIKCGSNSQTRERKVVLKNRQNNCFHHFLKEEIQIMKPEHILVLGKSTDEFLRKNLDKKYGKRMVYLMHYSRQACLPLSIEDKKNIIWMLQTGKKSQEEISNMKLGELSYFRKEIQ